MKGKARRLLSWVCVLALCMSLLPVTALASGTNGYAENTYNDKESAQAATGVTANKTVTDNKDGTYTVTLSVRGYTDSSTTTKDLPADIVLVVDTSTSMNDKVSSKKCGCTEFTEHTSYWGGTYYTCNACDDVYYEYNLPRSCTNEIHINRLDVAKDAAKTFVNGLLDSSNNVRIGLYDFSGTNRTDVDLTNSRQTLIDEIEGLHMPGGGGDGTDYGLGLSGASDILENSSKDRQKFVVFLSDGEPTYGDGESEAAALKQDGVTIFTVGIDIGNAARALKKISSEDEKGNEYFYRASSDGSSGDALSDILAQIQKIIPSLINAGKNAEMTDVINTESFELVDPVEGLDHKNGTLTWNIGDITGTEETVSFTIKPKADNIATGAVHTNKDVTLSFDSTKTGTKVTFEKGAIGDPTVPLYSVTYTDGVDDETVFEDERTYNLRPGSETPAFEETPKREGYTFVGWSDGKNTYEAGKQLPPVSGDVTYTAQWKNNMTPTAHDITIQVVLDGNTSSPISDGNVDTYIGVNPYQNASESGDENWNPGLYNAGKVTYDITYYDCKDIGFEAKGGYVIEAIDADLVYGQSGCQGIYEINSSDLIQYGDYMADNVKGGSTVTVYVRTLYSVEYYLDGEKLTEATYNDTTKYVTGTTVLEGDIPSVPKPSNGQGTDGYYPVDCNCKEEGKECKHTGYTDVNGAQTPSDARLVIQQDSTITLPSLPTKANYTVDGWWLDQSCTDKPDFEVGSEVLVSEVKPDNGTVIKFYSESTPVTAGYTVVYEFYGANGNKIDGTDGWTSDSAKFPQSGSATIGTKVDLELTNPALPKTVTRDDGNNYILVDGNYSCEITTEGPNNITVTYALDNWNDEDNTETGGDGIPDKYQALVKFAANENGAVSGTGTTQVFTLKNGDAYAESGTITPVEDGITITPANGYAFDIWTEGEGDSAVNPFTARQVNGGDTITFYANFDTDEIGTEDPDKGDGIPDKYEATVTYKVVGGTWSENGTGTVEKVYTLYKKNNEDGKWTQIDPVPTIQENDIPDVGNITPEDQYMLPGTWDNDPKGQSVDADSNENVYTYTLTQQAPSVKVEKSADPTSVKVGETINYTVTVTNDGNVDLANVAVQDEMMNSKTVTVTAKDSDGADVTPDGTWSENTYTITSLPAGVTYTFKYSYTATENDVKSGVRNTVTVDAPDLPEDPDDTVTITVDVLAPAIDIVKTLTAVNGEEVPTDYNAQVGDALTYTITVTNTGNTPFEEITVTDTMWASDKVTTAMLGEDQGIDVSEGQYQYTNKLMPETSIKITYIYTVQSSDIGTNEISNTAGVSTGTDPDDPTDKDTVNVRMDDYTVTITPADITIYTGGTGYGGVTDGDGTIIDGTETSGLPEPGYHIDLPDAVESWLQEHGADLDDAANLAEQLAFRYFDESGNIIRNWDLENQGVYSKNSDGTVSRYVYSLSPNTVEGENEGVQVRLAFTDDGNIVTTDNIRMDENTVSASYDMTIYDGGLQQSEIKAVFTAGGESITCTVKIGTGHLLVKSVTNEGTTTNGIEASSDAVTDTDTITAVADSNVTYYVNESEVSVPNDRVQLLVDEVSNSPDFDKAMGEDALERVAGEGNTLSNAVYDLAYMDLVDTQNGNTVVTMGEDQSLTIYWPVPDDAAEDSKFHVVHYTEMDRQNTTSESELESAKTIMPDTNTTTINGQKYVTFTTESFSPFALVYEKAPDPVASLDVTKTLTAVNGKTPGSSVSVGDTLTYTITVTNNGNVDLTNVTVTDTMSNGRTVTWVNLPDGVTNENGTLTITSLAAGTSVELTATYKVLRADASSNLVNTAKVTGTNPGNPDTPVTDEVQTPETPVNPYHPPIRPPVDPDKPELNTEDHYAYIVGYEDGSVQPEGDITRAEVATIFFRLLTDESRNEYWSQTNPYSDVSADDWFNNAVSTLTNAGVLDGYEDGTFKPNGNITRAEFATITARFFEATYDGENLFPDIEGHWAQDYINEAANAGIVNGYEDGTFRPQQYITRAEAVTMVNRTIERHPDADHLLDDMITWPDNPETAWYYEQIQEATNSHEYTMNTDDEQNPYEIWTKLLPNRDWSELEKEWSDANDGAGSGEVV